MFTELHEKEARSGEIEMSRRRQTVTQEKRDRATQLSVPRVFSIAQTPTKIHRIGLGREGERRK